MDTSKAPETQKDTHVEPEMASKGKQFNVKALLHSKKALWIGIGVLAVVVVVIVLLMKGNASDSNKSSQKLIHDPKYPGLITGGVGGLDVTSKDPVKRGQALSGGACEGQGSKKLASPAMHPKDI